MRYLLSLGSNCPDGNSRLQKAEAWLHANFSNVETSGIYSSKALNGVSAAYCNMVARVESEMSVTEITQAAKAYETECGRTPSSKLRGLVEMDVDIVAADRTILRPDEYTRPYFTTGLTLLSSNA
ncbi:MAG: 2-amino-4-hydroxy-6-hydroxymethyldihydropteridine diphosphokinase [Bacteroides sp.]|nr:2-amino-4-hydroxy-6-hydroxymethyldihydropteridine diphosphokinase [Bacteroides sp.]MCM1379265.1 2-amino-4-hydroxy-6-hydroxymethyldihydropteridine diphosphokinase [Bacteroides sp.]MCM1445077.1 2-amino-4-hydroxy-6-hydroxymethyldihydropteridine diphosphokinase [Prevotella sp.]